jgi:trigger factor
LILDIVFKENGVEISRLKEQTLRIRPVLSFRDGKIKAFDKLMAGVKAGETRVGKAEISDDAPNEVLRGKSIQAEFQVHDVKNLEMPKLTPAFLDELGGFANEEELRDAIKESLERRLEYSQRQEARKQILASLTVAANWDLPPELLQRQARRELERTVLELRRSGFGEDEIRSHGNELMQNSQQSTAKSLKEHFILERVAEDEKVEDLPEDYDAEIALIAQQSGENPRRVRAQLEKRNLMDTLRNQIIERKVIDLILANAKFKDVPYQPETMNSEALDESAGGEESEIPEAMHSEPGKIESPTQHP